MAVVIPAYNAARTLPQTHQEVREQGIVEGIILLDGGSLSVKTITKKQLVQDPALTRQLGQEEFIHFVDRNESLVFVRNCSRGNMAASSQRQ